MPPLTALTAFEAAARLSSFTKAASELGVTQAAVSRQVHLLEEGFGFPLFLRRHRRIELTEKGRLLSAAAGDAFSLIASTVESISKDDESDDLTIAATISFSHFWLLPRISEFSGRHPGIKLRIVTQDSIANFDHGGVDLAIRFGNGVWQDGRAELLFDDEIFPICSVEYADTIGEISDPRELVHHPLISNDSDDPNWTGWDEWLSAFSVKAPKRARGFRCSFYTEAIYAALNGQGIALGWKRLVDDLLRQRRLVRVTSHAISTRAAYFVVVPRHTAQKPAVLQFIAWIKEIADAGAEDH